MKSTRKMILDLLKEREAGKTICPSEVLLPHEKQDKDKMEKVREVARSMARNGEIEICQSGEAIDPETIKGPIRLRLKRLLKE